MKKTKATEYTVDKDEAGKRLDLFLQSLNPEYSRSSLSKLIKEGSVRINDECIKSSYKVHSGDKIVFLPSNDDNHNPTPETIPLNIIYENSDVIVIDKPAGMIVHPTTGNEKGTLVNALLNYYPKIREATIDENNPISLLRSGIVHRLDKDTSGVIIVAKNKQAMEFLSKEIKNRKAKKIYWALCAGWPEKESGRLTHYIGRHKINRTRMTEVGESVGRKAISDYRVLKYFKDKSGNNFSLLEFDIQTGRTHQIRLQAKTMNHPVVGDPVYTTKESIRKEKGLSVSRQMLHARRLSIRLPNTNKTETFFAEMPDDFKKTLSLLSQIK